MGVEPTTPALRRVPGRPTGSADEPVTCALITYCDASVNWLAKECDTAIGCLCDTDVIPAQEHGQRSRHVIRRSSQYMQCVA
jgi:hypothetical protein